MDLNGMTCDESEWNEMESNAMGQMEWDGAKRHGMDLMGWMEWERLKCNEME